MVRGYNETMDQYHLVEEIQPGTYRIDEGPGACNAYLLIGTKGALLVDTGLGIGDIHSVVKAITDQPITVVVTHRHCDHDGGADWYPSYFAHKGDDAAIYSFLSSNLAKRILVHAAGKKNVKFPKKPYRPKPQYIDEKKIFDLGNRQISIISLPGHTKGSIALVDEKEKMIFSGDDVNPYLWLQLPGCTSVQTWYDHAAPFVELCKNYRVFGGHSNGQIPQKCLENLIRVGKELLEKATFKKLSGHQAEYPAERSGDEAQIVFNKKHIWH